MGLIGSFTMEYLLQQSDCPGCVCCQRRPPIVKFFLPSLAASAVVGLLAAPLAQATTTQTVGAGSAVSSVDDSANFNSFTDTNLADYTEGGLNVTTVGIEYDTFDPFNGAGDGSGFYYPAGGTNGNWVTIETTDSSEMSGVEFLYGNGWPTDVSVPTFGLDSAVLYWQTLNGGVVDSFGSVVLDVGTVVGFSDPAGFDELQVSSNDGLGHPVPPGYNAIALDNLEVQLAPPAPVGDSDRGLTLCLGLVFVGLGLRFRRLPVRGGA
jgi:hypothetical protein